MEELELYTGAAEAEVPEAIEQLVTMYETGKGVELGKGNSNEYLNRLVKKVQDVLDKYF